MVIFTGRMPKEAMPAVLASSDACLVHLRGCKLFETVVPSKLFEIMAMERPIIMGVKGGARSIIKEAGAGVMMEPDCPESLIDAIRHLKAEKQAGRVPAAGARFYVAERYSRDILAASYATLLQSMMDPSVPNSASIPHIPTEKPSRKAA